MTGPAAPAPRDPAKPITRVEINTGTLRDVADALAPSGSAGTVTRRWGVVTAINTDRTLDVNIDGVVVAGVRRVTGYAPTINERVMLDVVETDMIVIGTVSTSTMPFARRMPGDIEATIRNTPKPYTLFLNGALIARTDYPELFRWVQDQGLLGTLFGTGNGVSTFQLPDWRGYVLSGSTTNRPNNTKFGATERVILPTNMATHTHQVSVDAHGNHDHGNTGVDGPSHTHGFGTSGVGDHGFHRPTHLDGAAGANAQWTTNYHVGDGAHGHNGGTGNASNAHTHDVTPVSAGGHTVRQVAVGDNTPFNIEQLSVSVNYLIHY